MAYSENTICRIGINAQFGLFGQLWIQAYSDKTRRISINSSSAQLIVHRNLQQGNATFFGQPVIFDIISLNGLSDTAFLNKKAIVFVYFRTVAQYFKSTKRCGDAAPQPSISFSRERSIIK